jgi:hypothetical protein
MLPAILIAAMLTATPCPTATLMRPGDVAKCEGALVPVDDVRWAIELDGENTACKAERAGCERKLAIESELWDKQAAEYERMLDAATAPAFSWTTLLVGVGIGLVAGGAAVYFITRE